jgi:tryptophan synthase alpha chain
MNRLEHRFARLRQARRKALVPFITAGDPERSITVPSMHALVRAGADVLELGIPFSDPEADGPVIQAASERALAAGFRLRDAFDLVREFRRTDGETPVVLMGYLNNLERLGYERFAAEASDAGVDGVIVVNMPPEEAQTLRPVLDAAGIQIIFLIAPTTTEARRRYLLNQSSGFVYFVSLKGVTGAQNLDADHVGTQVTALREMTTLPVLVGFGIKDGAAARRVAQYADGVVIGAALVATVAARTDRPDEIPAALEAQLREIRAAMDR